MRNIFRTFPEWQHLQGYVCYLSLTIQYIGWISMNTIYIKKKNQDPLK